MYLFEAVVFLGLCNICLAQTTSTSASPTTPQVTVTSISTFAIIILPSSSSSSTSPSTTPAVSPISPGISTSQTTSIGLPTTPYTGQALLTGTCNIPQYTVLGLQNGAVIEVPLIGCSDDRPECCPSLSPLASSSSTTTSLSAGGPTVTGIISMLSASPIKICPHDFTDIDPVCCPSGYSIYGQAVLGNTPCYSMVRTAVPIPSAVSNSIASAVAQTASATATVSVILNQVFALGLPCADGDSTGLSTGAKAGIGVGAGIGGLLLVGLIVFILVLVGKKRLKRKQQARSQDHGGNYLPQEKHMSATTSAMSPHTSMGSPNSGQMSPQFSQPQMHSYGFPASSAFGSNQSHATGSWGSQPHFSQPQHPRVPVEMQAGLTHEIDDGRRVTQPGSPDMGTSTHSNAPISEGSAYNTQRGRTGCE